MVSGRVPIPSAASSKSASTELAERESVRNSPVTVVGIGASAGGLEALSEFFRNVPADTGLAYVVVQHLSPTHGSILAELLARQATMPVHQAANGDRVEVNHAYVIAPDTKMTLTDGHLKLVPRDPDDRPPLPIDAFFRSLAEVQERRTIGVILSGTGSDGALGVRAIRGAGGIAFAQDPATATAEGMPRSAIATACIDIIAAPAEIAAHIVRLGLNPYLRPQAGDGSPDGTPHRKRDSETRPHDRGESGDDADTGTNSDALAAICAALRSQFGVDFDLYKMGTVERRIQRRMALRRIDTMGRYADLLREDGEELSTLYNDLLIGVTRFFRDPDLFDALTSTVLPDFIARRVAVGHTARADSGRDDAAIRVWIAGSSTGEEAYSFAICLLELLEAHSLDTPIQIFATDLNAAAISAARTGMYPRGIEADVTPERLNRFFRKEDNGYCVTKAVRDCCVFAVQNITADPPFSHLDIVSCRNVLIYLQPNAHARLLSVFYYALRPGGILVLGTSESVSTAAALFTAIDKKRRIYTRIPGPVHTLHLSVRPAHPSRSLIQDRASATAVGIRRSQNVEDSTGASANTPSPDVQRAADQIVLGSYAPAAVVVDDQLRILQFRGRTGKYIEPVAGTASFLLLNMVKSELATELRRALEIARNEARPARAEGVPFHDGKHIEYVSLDVRPFRVTGSDAKFFIISFEESRADGTRQPSDEQAGQPGTTSRGGARRGARASIAERKLEDNATELGELRQELEAAKRHLQTVAEEHASVVEEFQAANEEIQSSNEELQSTNEEIETSKEELQSLNEELITLNDELRGRNTEADHLNDDLTNLLSAMHVPVIMVGTDLHIRRFTAGAERMMNVIPTDVGRPIGDIKSNIDVGNVEELITHVIDTLEVTELEVRDRSGHWYMMHIRPYRTVDNRIDGAVIVYHDIDARKRAAEQLDDARRFAEAIVQTVREPLLVLDGSLCVVSANHAFYNNFGVSAGDTTTRSLFEFAGGDWNIPSLRILLDGVLRTGEPFDDVEVEHDFAARGHRTMLLNARRIGSPDNGPPLILLAIEDITDRKIAGVQLTRVNAELVARADELEAASVELRGKTLEALASNRAKADFLATMSHELRTPLNAIAGYAQLIDMGIRGPVTSAQHADLVRITRSQEHLMGLINEILNFAKLEAGAVSIAYTDVDVDELLLGVREMMALQMERAGLHYDVSRVNGIDGQMLTVRGDVDKIRQILLNLLGNALKFTRSGGNVEVTCDITDDAVAIHVGDTGVGVHAAQRTAIFEPFVQGDTSLTRSAEGVGLGLAISRSLAHAMGGDISVESNVGIGSVFTLTLKRGPPGADGPHGATSAASAAHSAA
ncbi:MAG TPA: chemotaxis protein CheB [Gemmatimonadaceae bacterium]|nr:chemotaxis protein CheB [Gemmatimonadaceae bacterium]